MRTTYEDRELKTKNQDENLIEGIGEYWGCFYKANPHRFALDYFEYPLHIFQQVLIYFMFKSDLFCFLATRGLGKSWLVAVFATIICVLKPGTIVVVVAKRKNQAKQILTKKILGELYTQSEALRKEIKDWSINSQECAINFWCGSRIEAVVGNDDARSARANVIIMDEYRMLKQQVVDDVILPFSTTPRQPGYLKNPKYSKYVEENKELYLSSGYYTHHWSYARYKDIVKAMLKGQEAFACSIPFTCSLEHGLLTKKKIRREMEKESMSEASFLMEYCGLFWNESDDAFFKSVWINPCRTLESVYYLPDNLTWLKYKKKKEKPWCIPRVKGEIRIIGVDIALAKGNKNDNSVYTLIRLIPNGRKYKRYIVNMEAYNGMEGEKQAIRIKQIFYDFEADYIIIDTNGLGTTVWSYMQKANYDSERDIWYEAFTCFNEDNTVDKSLARNAIPVVYSFKASEKINHEMAMSLRDNLMNQNIELPISHMEAKELIYEKGLIKPNEDLEKVAMLETIYIAPYLQISILIGEMINLQYSTEKGLVKIREKASNRKDRYSSVAMGNYLADLLERENLRSENKETKFLFLT